jgi:hypothetical protein
MRPPLAGNNPAHVADSQRSLLKTRCFQKQALARIAKSGGLRFHSELPAVLAVGKAAGGVGGHKARELRWGAFLLERGFVMPNRIDIDHTHSRAIVRNIGERLRVSLKPEPELPTRFKKQIDRLREAEEPSQSIVPSAEHWKEPRG